MMNIEQIIKGFERTHITMDLRRYADNTYMADATADKFNTYRSGWVDGQAALTPQAKKESELKATYCLGYTHDKCKSCLHSKTWHILNELPDSQRLPMQQYMTRINSDKCRMTNMGEYIFRGQL